MARAQRSGVLAQQTRVARVIAFIAPFFTQIYGRVTQNERIALL